MTPLRRPRAAHWRSITTPAQVLRAHWRAHRSPLWLFPAPTRHGLEHCLAHKGGPVTRSSLQSAFRRALQQSGSARTTQIYTHLTREVRATLTDPLNQLRQGL